MPKLRLEQLSTALKKGIAPAYIVSGDEPLLIQEACDAIRAAARTSGYSEREVYHTDAGFDWHYLLQNLNSLSLFSDKKIIEVRVPNGKVDDNGSAVIAEYCNSAPDDTLLLLVFPKLDKKAQNSSWLKSLEKIGHNIVIWPIGAQQLHRWVEIRMQSAGLRADSTAIDILCNKVEGNLLAAAQEIEKLKLLAIDGMVNSELMTHVVMDSARYSIFGLVDKALAGDSRAAVKNLHGLQSEGVTPMTVLWSLTREIRLLCNIKESIERGESFDLAAKKNGVWDKRKPLVRNALQRLSLGNLQTLLRTAALADRTIKGLAQGDVWNIFLDITLSLTGTQTFSNTTKRMVLSS